MYIPFFLTKIPKVFVCDMLAGFLQLFPEYIAIKPLIIVSEVWISTQKSPADGVNWKHFNCAGHISWEANGIWLWIYFSDQILIYRLLNMIIFHKMLCMRRQFENDAKIYINLLYTHTLPFKEKSILFPNHSYLFLQRLHISYQKCQLV